MSRPVKIAVLASGRGSNLQAIIDAVRGNSLDAEIAVVISNNKDAAALSRAQKYGIPTALLEPLGHEGREEYDIRLAEQIKRYEADLVVLAGWMRVLSQKFLEEFPDKVINIHPSLLPAFPGLNAQKQAFEYGVKYSGCTVHFVDAGVDTGPVIDQSVVPVQAADTVESLADRILQAEHKLYPQVIQLFSEGRIVKNGRKVKIMEVKRNGTGAQGADKCL
ncbi:MAG: phosphoribosylglycinamide formyltransferase [Bacillota bacterium]